MRKKRRYADMMITEARDAIADYLLIGYYRPRFCEESDLLASSLSPPYFKFSSHTPLPRLRPFSFTLILSISLIYADISRRVSPYDRYLLIIYALHFDTIFLISRCCDCLMLLPAYIFHILYQQTFHGHRIEFRLFSAFKSKHNFYRPHAWKDLLIYFFDALISIINRRDFAYFSFGMMIY